MEDNGQKRSLTEISHLFLSSVREKQTNGAPRPQRIPPGQARPVPMPGAVAETPIAAQRAALSADDLAHALGRTTKLPLGGVAAPARRTPPVSAVLSAHFNARQSDRVREYARHLSALEGRIGLIELDGAEFRLSSFEAGEPILDPDLDGTESAECHDIHEIAEALDEMNCDVDRWLVLAPNPRTPEARAVLRSIGHWVLLSTCDHDGVVSSYRLLKGLAESYRPRLSLALLNGADEEETKRIYRKLTGVCQQFLNWELGEETPVMKATRTIEHLVLCCRPTRDKGQIAAAPQWGIVNNFLQNVKAAEMQPSASAQSQNNQEELDPMEDTFRASSDAANLMAEMPSPAASFPRAQSANPFIAPAPAAAPALRLAGSAPARDTSIDVLDLAADAGPESILTAILQQNNGELIECPVRAPMCDGARLAITRERKIVLVAIARSGLSDLRAIGQAFRWVSENRALIAMAVPQFSIDTRSAPNLRLLVDHADVSADLLQPILHAAHVTIQAYRKVRWGSRTGLFLEAA